MAKARPYYSDRSLSARYYDAVTAADERLAGDLDIYADLAPPGGSILELGCGAGRLTLPLAERGFTVTGVDVAPAMLAQARAKLVGLPAEVVPRLELRQADMTALAFERQFDLVICPYFTLAHVPVGAAWRNTFATAARRLAQGGLAAFHLPRREIMALPGPGDPHHPVLEIPLHAGHRLQLYLRERRYRADIGRLDQTLEYAVIDPRGVRTQTSSERLTYYMDDPQPAAAAAGLRLDRSPIELGGVGDIWVFRKA